MVPQQSQEEKKETNATVTKVLSEFLAVKL